MTSVVALHVIQTARSPRLSVIGKGVETGQQAAIRHGNGAQMAQGWLFSKALPINAGLDLLNP